MTLARFLVAVGMLSLTTGIAMAQETTSSGNRIANPGAETGVLDPWVVNGFVVSAYGVGTAPSRQSAGLDALGQQFFAGLNAGATLRQDVSFEDRATSIDQSGFVLEARGYLGAAAGTRDDPVVAFQPLGADGSELGAPSTIGPSTDSDRRGETRLVLCSRKVNAPVGTRKVRVTVTAGGGTAAVDRLSLEEAPIFSPVGSGGTNAPSGCESVSQPPSATPPAAPPAPPSAPSSPAPRTETAKPEPRTAALTAFRFTRNSVTIRLSRRSRVMVRIERATIRTKRTTWKRTKSLTITAPAHRMITRRFARLPRGRYRFVARAEGSGSVSRRETLFGAP